MIAAMVFLIISLLSLSSKSIVLHSENKWLSSSAFQYPTTQMNAFGGGGGVGGWRLSHETSKTFNIQRTVVLVKLKEIHSEGPLRNSCTLRAEAGV